MHWNSADKTLIVSEAFAENHHTLVRDLILANILGMIPAPLCANISETSRPSTITVGRGKKSHLDEHKQVQHFFRCVGSFGA